MLTFPLPVGALLLHLVGLVSHPVTRFTCASQEPGFQSRIVAGDIAGNERPLVGVGLGWSMHSLLGNAVSGVLFGRWGVVIFGFLEKALSLSHLNY